MAPYHSDQDTGMKSEKITRTQFPMIVAIVASRELNPLVVSK